MIKSNAHLDKHYESFKCNRLKCLDIATNLKPCVTMGYFKEKKENNNFKFKNLL